MRTLCCSSGDGCWRFFCCFYTRILETVPCHGEAFPDKIPEKETKESVVLCERRDPLSQNHFLSYRFKSKKCCGRITLTKSVDSSSIRGKNKHIGYDNQRPDVTESTFYDRKMSSRLEIIRSVMMSFNAYSYGSVQILFLISRTVRLHRAAACIIHDINKVCLGGNMRKRVQESPTRTGPAIKAPLLCLTQRRWCCWFRERRGDPVTRRPSCWPL